MSESRDDLTFSMLRKVTSTRSKRWANGAECPIEFHATELAEECGEVCGAVKKLYRLKNGMPGGKDMSQNLAEELADVVISADILAGKAGINLGAAVIAKFNATSEKHGFPERLGGRAEVSGGKCSHCGEPISEDNPGLEMDGPGLWVCNDCHHIQWGTWLLASQLDWPGKNSVGESTQSVASNEPATHAPLECLKCGAHGKPHPIDGDHQGWLCPSCYEKEQVVMGWYGDRHHFPLLFVDGEYYTEVRLDSDHGSWTPVSPDCGTVKSRTTRPPMIPSHEVAHYESFLKWKEKQQ